MKLQPSLIPLPITGISDQTGLTTATTPPASQMVPPDNLHLNIWSLNSIQRFATDGRRVWQGIDSPLELQKAALAQTQNLISATDGHSSIPNLNIANGLHQNRVAQYLKSSMTLRYGSLPKEHPAYQDALKAVLASRPNLTAAEVKLVVMPKYPDINAMMSGDGTIYISLKLMEFCDYYQEISGICGHELEHDESDDIANSQQRSEKNQGRGQVKTLATQMIRETGIKRFQEHRADIQGAMRKLNEAGTNPLGLKIILEKLHQQQMSKRSHRNSLTHGSALDRALAAGAWTRFEDLESLNSTLDPISKERKRGWRKGLKVPTETLFQIFHRRYQGSLLTQLTNQRFEVIKNMTTNERSFALAEMHHHWKDNGLVEAEENRTQDLMGHTADLVDQDLLTLLDDSNDLPYLRYLHYTLGLGISITPPNPPFIYKSDRFFHFSEKRIQTYSEDTSQIRDQQDLIKLRSLVDTITNHKLPFGMGSPKTFIQNLNKQIFESNIFGSLKEGNFDYEEWFVEMQLWAEAWVKYSAKKSIHATHPDKILQYATDKLRFEISKQKLKPQTLNQFLKNHPELISFAIKDTLTSDEIQEIKSNLLEITEYKEWSLNLVNIICHTPIRDLPTLILSIMTPYTHDMPVKKVMFTWNTLMHDALKTAEKLTMSSSERLAHLSQVTLAFAEAYTSLVHEHPLFSNLSEAQKKTIIHKYRSDTGCFDNRILIDLDLNFKKSQKYREQSHIHNLITSWVNLSDSDLTPLHTLIHTEFREYMIPTSDSNNSGEKLISIFSQTLSYRLSSLSYIEMKNTITRWEAGGIPTFKLLSQYTQFNGSLILNLLRELKKCTNDTDRIQIINWISNWTIDPILTQRFNEYALKLSMNQSITFSEKLQVAFDPQLASGHIDIKIELIENEMESRQQVTAVKDRIAESSDDFIEEGTIAAGLATITSVLPLRSRNSLEDLKLLLETKKSDLELKERYASSIFTNHNIKEEASIDGLVEYSNAKLPQGEQAIGILLSQERAGKLYLTKRFLVDGELIIDPKKRKPLFDLFLNHAVTSSKQEQGLYSVMQDVTDALTNVKNWQPLFHALAPTIADHIALPPEKTTKWNDVYEFEANLGKNGIRKYQRQQNNVGKLTLKSLRIYTHQLNLMAQEKASEWLINEGIGLESNIHDMSPMDLLIQLAQKTGAMSVRFLQMLGQFIEIPTAYQNQFNSLYDDVEGQSKLAAISVVERNWPDMWKHVKRFGKRLGGGSLMSVYELEMHDGQSLVIRVCNPNIRYQLKESRSLFDETLDQMKRKKSIDRKTHERLKLAVDMVNEWIEAELDFSGFMPKDAEFRSHHNGTQPDGFEYSTWVPNSNFPKYEIPDNNRFQIEELIIGENLTQWESLKASGHDMKQVMSLMAKDFEKQLRLGQLHGDVHIGNYRVTPQKQVAILDRTFYLYLNPQEQEIFNQTLTGEMNLPKIIEYFMSLVPTHSRNPRTQMAVMAELASMAEHIRSGDYVKLNQSLIQIRQAGVEIPLKLSLILRNIHALSDLSQKAGFKNLAEAFMYEPK